MTARLQRLFALREDETVPVLLSCLVFWLLMSGYYILRPIRDEMGIAGGQDLLHRLFLVTLAVTALAAPAVGWLVRRFRREVFLPAALRFFALNLVLFFAALKLADPVRLAWAGRVFYVWLSVFNLAALSLFWSFMADGFGYERGRRLFGMVAVAGTVGAITGSGLTTALVEAVGRPALLLAALVLIEGAARLVPVLSRRFDALAGDAPRPAAADSGILAGLTRIARSPYLAGTAAYVFLYTSLNTVLYFEKTRLVAAGVAGATARTAVLGSIDLWANGLTLVVQLLLTGRLLRRLGAGPLLVLLPVGFGGAFLALAIHPTLALFIVLQTVLRAANYALAKPARETLFTVVPREDRYKAKNVIDTFVYRGGDAAGSLITAGATAVAPVAVAAAAAWAALAVALGRRQRTLAAAPPADPVN
ncbi:MAG TPA: MFS transporter [Candidatus Krumholzibacteria bacterium]|nr:MFS transporter [Candidatus Krumholzibacteria bacterium]